MYKISSSESSNEKATDFETKAMLYLMNYYQEADRIHYFVIDFLMIYQELLNWQMPVSMCNLKGLKIFSQHS